MGFDEGLAERVRTATGTAAGFSERKMFGGLCFLLGGNMSFGVVGSELMVRVGPDAYATALALPHAREMASRAGRCGAWCSYPKMAFLRMRISRAGFSGAWTSLDHSPRS